MFVLFTESLHIPCRANINAIPTLEHSGAQAEILNRRASGQPAGCPFGGKAGGKPAFLDFRIRFSLFKPP